MGKDDSQAANALLTTREALGHRHHAPGLPAAAARCIAGRMVQMYSVAALNDPNFQTDYPNAPAQIQQMAVACR